MTKLADELLPCPFCGEDAGIGYGPDGPFVNCVGCLASTNTLVPHGQTEAEAIAAWNTRAALRHPAPDAGDMQGLVERLHDLVRNAYRVGAEDVHRAWVAGNGQSEADFGEAASDYVDGMELPDFPTAIQSLTAQLAETECARKAILTTAASVAWDLAAERGKVAELVQGLDMWVAYDDLDEAEFAGVHPMVAYSQAINNSRALIERMK